MKKLMVVFTAMVLFMGTIGSQADLTQIQDEDWYIPSTGLTLGPWGTVWSGVQGWGIADPFQINLLYQAGILNEDIEAIDTYDPDGTWDYNFSDNECYVLNINPAGGLLTYEYPDQYQWDSGNSNVQWTLTGWHQTILGGYLEDRGGSVALVVDPESLYRPFPNDPPVNDVEVFSGLVETEVYAYIFNGDMDEFTTLYGGAGFGGITLDVETVASPEPTSMAGLALLGLGGLVAGKLRRKKS